LDGKDFATETTLTALAAEDFATETTLNAVLTKIIAAPATEAKQDATITAIGNSLDVVDSVDGNIINPSSTSIPASSAGYLEIVANLAAEVKEIQVIEDIGEFMGLYSGAAAAETFVCVLPQGFTGSRLPVQIPAGTRLSIRNMKDATIDSNTRLTINFLG